MEGNEKKMLITLPLELHRDLKTFAASQGITLKAVIADALRQAIPRKGILHGK